MENEFYLQQQSLCNITSYFNNINNSNGNGNGDGNNWDSSFHSSLTSSVHPTQAPLISTDPEFAERAARFSMFGRRSSNGRGGVEEVESELGFPRVSSCQGIKFPSPAAGSDFVERIRIHDEVKMNGFSPENGEESSVSEPQKSTSKNDFNPRKRKSNPRAKTVTKSNQIQESKRTKSDESNENRKNDEKAKGKSKDDSTEPPKDYIHVRARRGQATDSHSLAERVRREKISKRMKFLQDLVPGCNKVTGKAVMLDEIINYVQSLQRQVEFLSMKLSTLNPTTDINVEALLSKDLHQARSLLSQSMFALESSPVSPAFPYSGYSSQMPVLKKNAHSDESESSFSMNPLTLTAQRSNNAVQFPLPADGFDQSACQVSMWIDELHNVVQMGYGQNELQDFQGSLTTSDMKMEQ